MIYKLFQAALSKNLQGRDIYDHFCQENDICYLILHCIIDPIMGAIECLIQTLKGLQKHLEDHLSNFLISYRSTPHTTTGVTPSELFLKCDL